MLEKIRAQNHKISPSEKEGAMVLEKEKIETGIKAQTVVALAKGIENGEQDQYRVETITSNSPELTPELLQDISDFFRYTFNNAFPEYAVCTDCDVSLSAPEVFDTQGKYVPLEKLDNNQNLPCCPDCNKQMKFFHDAEQVFQKIQENFKQKAHISLLRENTDGKLAGITFAYFDTFKNAFKKEWSNEYLYMKEQDDIFDREKNSFLDKINAMFWQQEMEELFLESEVFCWNCTAINPEAKGLRNVSSLVKELFSSVEEENKEKHFILETRTDSAAYKLLKILGAINVPDIFPSGNGQAFMIGRLEEIIDLKKKQKIPNKNIHS